MSLHVRDNGVWKQASSLSVRDNSLWKPATDGYVRDGGIWKPFLAPPLTVEHTDSYTTGTGFDVDLNIGAPAADREIFMMQYNYVSSYQPNYTLNGTQMVRAARYQTAWNEEFYSYRSNGYVPTGTTARFVATSGWPQKIVWIYRVTGRSAITGIYSHDSKEGTGTSASYTVNVPKNAIVLTTVLVSQSEGGPGTFTAPAGLTFATVGAGYRQASGIVADGDGGSRTFTWTWQNSASWLGMCHVFQP